MPLVAAAPEEPQEAGEVACADGRFGAEHGSASAPRWLRVVAGPVKGGESAATMTHFARPAWQSRKSQLWDTVADSCCCTAFVPAAQDQVVAGHRRSSGRVHCSALGLDLGRLPSAPASSDRPVAVIVSKWTSSSCRAPRKWQLRKVQVNQAQRLRRKSGCGVAGIRSGRYLHK